MLVLFILFVYAILNSRYSRLMIRNLYSRYNRIICLCWGSCFIFALIIPIIQFTFDFSFVSTMLHQMICLEIGIMLYSFLLYKEKSVINTILDSFILQSFIQIIAFLSPSFLSITDYFRSDFAINKRSINYASYRVLAISGSSFFGLASAYAIIFVLLAFYWNKWKYKSPYIKCLFVAMLLFGGLSAGRTSVVGIFIFIISFLVRTFKRKRITAKKIISLIIIVLCAIGLGNLINKMLADNRAWQGFLSYILQFYYNFKRGSGIINATSSTSVLFNNMYFKLKLTQLLIGDGRYTTQDGSYYMQTDAGYMRNILYFGIGGTLLLMFFQYKMIFSVVKTKYTKLFAIILFLCLIILEIKAQIIGFLIISQSIIVLCCLAIEELENNCIDSTNLPNNEMNTMS